MGDGNDDRTHIEDMRSLRELFKGRFSDVEMGTLYELNNRDKMLTLRYIMAANPADVSTLIQQEREAWTIVRRKRRQISRDIVDRVRSGIINTEARQFACGPCDSSWWKKVPDRKEVSKCNSCKVKYDPIPRDREWGWAEFKCPRCEHEFGGFAQMGNSSPCFQCKHPVFPTRVQPPTKKNGRRTGNTHSCDACRRGRVGECAHPATRLANNLPRVMMTSHRHDSSGSTVDTFLPQDDLTQGYHQVYDNISDLPSIPEEPPGAGSDDSSDDNGAADNIGNGPADNIEVVYQRV